jgi:predicted MFS family arabinose efflux permease
LVSEQVTVENIWRHPPFLAYLGSTGFSGMAFAMQQLLLSWILIGILLLPADEVGLIQAAIGVPGIFLMLMGGASADRADPRNLLVAAYLLAPVFPLFLIVMDFGGRFDVWSVVIWGLGIGVVQAYSMPAQQAILSRISGGSVQQAVTAATAIGFVVQVVGLGLAGQIDSVGISAVLFCQAVVFMLAAWTMLRVGRAVQDVPVAVGSRFQEILGGLRATLDDRVIANVLGINFVSSIFNAGSFMTVFPFVVKRVYDGDALILSGLMAVFFAGAAVSNALLLRYMPLNRPGRLFLILQISRILILGLLFIEGDWWVLVVAVVMWGLNMGVTSNLARTIVQESAAPVYRGRILSVLSVSMIGSAPIGAIILGWLIESVGTLNALVPAMLVSLLLFGYGVSFTRIWAYCSPSAEAH